MGRGGLVAVGRGAAVAVGASPAPAVEGVRAEEAGVSVEVDAAPCPRRGGRPCGRGRRLP